MTDIDPPNAMPPKVAAAINDVMKAVKRLEKGEFNQHGRFKFTGIDDFLDASRPLCAEAGLVIVQDEEDFEVVSVRGKDGDAAWLKLRFTFTLAHISGETWNKPIRRSIMVMASMGAQAFGAAQSYVEKQFLRSLFQMSTGDNEDADNHAQGSLPPVKRYEAPPKADNGVRRLSSALAKDRGLDKELRDAVAGCTTLDELAEWDRDFDRHTAEAPNSWLDAIHNSVILRKEEILRETGEVEMDREFANVVG